jgi:aminopeptidase-like protein
MTDSVGEGMLRLAQELYPVCRSITGDGLRETLRCVGQHLPVEVHEVPSGTSVFDWSVPKEWNIRDAYVKNSRGERIIDFRKSNLHVLNYSTPIQRRMRLDELKPHLYSAPEHPAWIPYRTSYYTERWGFCLTHDQMSQLGDEEYEVCIDSTLSAGSLTYGECWLPGVEEGEVLISCHVCHPSLANDNLSGLALATFAAKAIQNSPRRRYGYRFLFVPGTIGAITWLALNERQAGKVQHGLVLSCVGDAGQSTYKKSQQGNAKIDRAVTHVLQHSGSNYEILEFTPYGYDERQYCSPGFDLPVGCFMRTPNGRYPEYHTSADNLDLLQPAALNDSYSKLLAVFDVLEHDRTYVNLNPKCEPQLGKRGLYATMGGTTEGRARELALLWVLNQSNGSRSLLDIAERSGIRFELIKAAASALEERGLVKRVESR